MQQFFKRIQDHFHAQLPFVIYRKPNTSVVKAILQQNDILHSTQDFSENGFVFSPFNDDQNSIIMPLSDSDIFEEAYAKQEIDNTSVHTSFKIDDDQKTFHIRLVEKGIDLIKNKDIEKVVLSRVEEVKFDRETIFLVLQRFLEYYPASFVYLWYHPKVGLWLGATPETLLKIEGRHFSIMALAGTQNYTNTLNVTWKEKELKEQQFVTDFILENIKSVVNNIQVSQVQTVKTGTLLHLKTDIKGRLKSQNTNLKQLLCSLHPTPAVCGYPKEKAKQFILNNENYNREFYTGFLGELNFDAITKPRTGNRNIEHRAYAVKRRSTQLYVNLRCTQIKDDKALIYVGGGITVDSNAEHEWEETVAKSMVVKNVL